METDQLSNNYGATVLLNCKSTILLLITGVQAMREIINEPSTMPLLKFYELRWTVIMCLA